MQPLVRGALGVAVLAAIGAVVGVAPRPALVTSSVASASAGVVPVAASLAPMPCPPRHLPEGDSCVPLPDLASDARGAEPQHDRRSRGATFEVIPRKPDRAPDAELYVYPIDGAPLFFHGFDDDGVRAEASPVSLELAAERGAPVRALLLDGQKGNAKVVGVGRLIGNTVITRHDLAGDPARSWLVVSGHLDAVAPDVAVGKELEPYAPLGFAGDSGNPGLVSLYLEVRLLREGERTDGLSLTRLVDPAVSVPTDARNALKLR